MYIIMIVACILSSLTMTFHMRSSTVLSGESKRWFALMFLSIVITAAAEALGDCLQIIEEDAGKHFDPVLTEIFVRMVREEG